jgi:hypothetical protein
MWFFNAFFVGFVGSFATAAHIILLCNPFWFRYSWLKAFNRTNVSIFSLINNLDRRGWY